MKILLLSILLSLELSINTFNNQAVIDYARKWCNSTNPYYNYYEEDDSSNFVTQSLIRGGIDFFGCKMGSKGSIREYNDLTKCLRDMGWYTYRFVTKEFKAGYPVLYGKMIAIATYVNGTEVKVCTHPRSFFREYPLCDVPDIQFGESVYFYPDIPEKNN